ncbi:nuclear transport factor 2 family protein [Mycolicibacterium confluentis]|uniref:nuclear transport factor 2 family protein n=1 Tax=Mycolicibacterium confluentis TaxID=28047 RepID=UPI0027E3329C|nr:nuclear transport factor 2 family protein [Mycolicibacterium confluentis]
MASTVRRYLDLVAEGGRVDDIVDLYAEDAVIEDPVGDEPIVGHQTIWNFYGIVENDRAETELVTLRATDREAAFVFNLTLHYGARRMRIEVLEVMVFGEDGKIASMKAYWSAENITEWTVPDEVS